MCTHYNALGKAIDLSELFDLAFSVNHQLTQALDQLTDEQLKLLSYDVTELNNCIDYAMAKRGIRNEPAA